VLNVGWFPHSVMQQARTHRVGVSFDVQSMRYTGERICRAARSELELEEVFYLRPVCDYSDRKGKKYHYSIGQRAIDLELCRAAAERYRDLLAAGSAIEAGEDDSVIEAALEEWPDEHLEHAFRVYSERHKGRVLFVSEHGHRSEFDVDEGWRMVDGG